MVERWFAGGAIGGVAVWCPGPGVTRDGVGRADSRAHADAEHLHVDSAPAVTSTRCA
jgi:hypothetical protein